MTSMDVLEILAVSPQHFKGLSQAILSEHCGHSNQKTVCGSLEVVAKISDPYD